MRRTVLQMRSASHNSSFFFFFVFFFFFLLFSVQVLLDRPISRCTPPPILPTDETIEKDSTNAVEEDESETFSGAYLDNGVGCFVAAKLAELVAAEASDSPIRRNLRVLFAFASHEEIGRFGSRVIASQFAPDVVIAVDVNHDYVSAPGVASERYQPLELGKGPTLCVGSIASPPLNALLEVRATCSFSLKAPIYRRAAHLFVVSLLPPFLAATRPFLALRERSGHHVPARRAGR